MKHASPLVVAALLATAGCVGANATSSPDRAAVAAATSPEAVAAANARITDPDDRIVCRRETVVGSNRPEKVCITVRQQRTMRDRADEMRRRGDGGATPGEQPIGS